MTDALDEKSAIDDVFSKSSDMGADSAAPGAEPKAQVAEDVAPKAEDIVPADQVKDDDEAPPQGRDPATGRFVPVTELVAERKKLKGERDAETKLRTDAEARAKGLEDQIAQLQRSFQMMQQPRQQQPASEPRRAPDPIMDPEGYAQFQQEEINARFLDMHVNMSEKYARIRHTDAVVDKALQSAHQKGIASNFMRASDPFEALVTWHRRQEVEAEIGGDFEAFKKRIEDQATAKALASLKATGSAQPQAQHQRFPTTLADQTAQGQQGAVLTEGAAIDSVFDRQARRRA